jgi:hypothetical protein
VFHRESMAVFGQRRGRRMDQDRSGRFSTAVHLIRHGESVLTLIDPRARGRDTDAFEHWLQARLTIAELPRLLLPACDARCNELNHDPDDYVVLSDLAVDRVEPRPASWWAGWNDTLQERHAAGGARYAGAPAMPLTPEGSRLVTGTRLRRLATTDPQWVTYDGSVQETLFGVVGGPMAGLALIAVTFGPASLLPALAGVLIAPDHPPARDANVAVRLLAAGWAAVERGLPYEDA